MQEERELIKRKIAKINNDMLENINNSEKYKALCDERYLYQNILNFIENNNYKNIKIDLLNQIKDFFIEEDEDGDYTITQDACEVADYLDDLLKKEQEDSKSC